MRARSIFAALGAFLALGRAEPVEAAVPYDEFQTARSMASSTGPEAATGVAFLWRLWGFEDPARIERELKRLSEGGAHLESVRLYAMTYRAWARRRRGDFAGALELAGRSGLAGNFSFLGPLPLATFGGEIPPWGPGSTLGKRGGVAWRLWQASQLDAPGVFDLQSMSAHAPGSCMVAATWISVPHSQQVHLSLGVEGTFRLLVDGQHLLQETEPTHFDFDRFGIAVALPAGAHEAEVLVCSEELAPRLGLRATDGQGAPLKTSSTPPDGWSVPKEPLKVKSTGIQHTFETSAGRAGASAQEKEAFARYLFVTGGDTTRKRARALVEDAIRQEFTVDRALLAFRLAGERNEARSWLDQAEQSASDSPRDQVRMNVARAQHELHGLAPRDARRHFERVLAIDPSNVEAAIELARLLTEGDRAMDAIAVLRRALARKPRSAYLLATLATTLRQAEQSADADAVDRAVVALDLDETSIRDALEGAALRGQAYEVRHWASRIDEGFRSIDLRAAAARSLASIGESEAGHRLLLRSVDRAPDDRNARWALAQFEGAIGKIDAERASISALAGEADSEPALREYLELSRDASPLFFEHWRLDVPGWRALQADPAGTQEQERVLASVRVTRVHESGLASSYHQSLVEIRDTEAEARNAITSVGYDAARQTLELRRAVVHHPDGRIDSARVLGEHPIGDPSIATYTSERALDLDFGHLDPGDVLELEVVRHETEPRYDSAGAFDELESMGDGAATVRSELVFDLPASLPFHWEASPGIAHFEQAKGARHLHTFRGEKLTATAREARMPALEELLPLVHVSSFSSWDEVGALYGKMVAEASASDANIARLAQEIASKTADSKERARLVFEVATRLQYVGLELGIEGIRPRPARQSLLRGWGDCKDKAVVMLALF